MSRSTTLALLALTAIVAAACQPIAGAAPPQNRPAELRPLTVANVIVEIGIGSPIPVDIIASGTWPDLCAQLAETSQTIADGKIEISLLATPADPNCPPDHLGVPFRVPVPLNVVELPAGSYTVSVNGTSASFDWQPGSTAPTVPAPLPAQVDEVNVEIEGGAAVKSVSVIVSGRLPDTCSQVGDISLLRQDTSFWIIVLTNSFATGQPCQAAGIPFQLAIPLNLAHLPATTYQVNVNGVTASFDPRVTPAQGAGERGSTNG